MHIFLSGDLHVGKTTIINSFLDRYNISPGGFVTVKRETGDECRVHMLDCLRPDDFCGEHNLVGVCRKNERHCGIPEVFDTLGVSILNRATGAPLILMDELSFLESEALEFQKTVLDVLDGTTPVLGVVRSTIKPFLNQVRGHPNVLLVFVDENNREEVLDQFLNGYCSHLVAKGRAVNG